MNNVNYQSKNFLLGKNLDVLLVGGLGLFFFAGFHFFVQENADLGKIAKIMYALSMIVNWPHFMFSYQLLYWDKRKLLFKKFSYVWAGFVIPIALFSMLGLGLFSSNSFLIPFLIQSMFLAVGWHYVKQVFGTIVVSSAIDDFYLTKKERWALAASLYSIWALSFFSGQIESTQAQFEGIKYSLMGLPSSVLIYNYTLVYLTTAVAVFFLIKRYIKEGRTISTTGIVSYLGLFVWFVPFVSHPHFIYMIPFFHSIQYLLFVSTLKFNQWKSKSGLKAEAENRRKVIYNTLIYTGLAVVSGVVFFLFIPEFLDVQGQSSSPEIMAKWGPTLFVGLFSIFINLHHYFIDNVIWRSDNEDIRKFLFTARKLN